MGSSRDSLIFHLMLHVREGTLGVWETFTTSGVSGGPDAS